jgi:hypothetical protein
MPEARHKQAVRRGAGRRWLAAAGAAALLLTVSGTTEARWSDSAAIPGTALRTGRLEVAVDGSAPADRLALLPGDTTATVLTVRNAGDVPLDYTVAVTGTHPDAKDLAGALTRDVRLCGGGSPGPLAPGTEDDLCVEVGLPAGAPDALAGAATDLTVSVHATRDGWTDEAAVTGTHLATPALTPPTLTCAGTLGSLTAAWDPVPGATGYRIHSGLLGDTVQDVGPGTLSTMLTGAGLIRVQALFGSWVSPDSDECS